MTTLIKSIPLSLGEYNTEKTAKDTIYLHHTAGGHRPDWTIAGWNSDKSTSGAKLRVATSYVIGGLSTSDGNGEWDGTIVRCFPDEMWAHHLGLQAANNEALNRKSIGIELCNYGPLKLSGDGKFYNYVNKQVPASQVIELSKPFKGYKYYHKYTDRQIESLRHLLIDLGRRFSIDLGAGLKKYILNENQRIPAGLSILPQQRWLNAKGFRGKDGKALAESGFDSPNLQFAISCVGQQPFDVNKEALNGFPGIWTHVNVRADKFDCSPQPNLISMLRSL
jgi:hypothetical protein